MQQEFTVTTEEAAIITVMVIDGELSVFSMTHEIEAKRDATNSFVFKVGKPFVNAEDAIEEEEAREEEINNGQFGVGA